MKDEKKPVVHSGRQRPCQTRYVNSQRWIANKAKRKARHEKRVARLKAYGEKKLNSGKVYGARRIRRVGMGKTA